MGRNNNGSYVLEDSKFQVFYSNRQQSACFDVSHKRLGHPSDKILLQLYQNKLISLNKHSHNMCEACQLGKSSRLSFSASSFSASKPLERIHCDLWGPAPIVSVQGFRYYVILIDNFSRFSWFYPLKNKSDFSSIFIMFQKLVEAQFKIKIGIFQCDGGGEVTSKRFLQHLEDSGIKQLISCPHTPQQNGLAERKHRHVTELGLSIMFQSQNP
ncbi:Retrovirus-related Pol polyprotein from transposon RE2 [Cardamine amara subsp. amara]|uniref:Retrovirus-related Pol polyprotein from transposon RE2 n=1 Tax=Cardamine amara subsp. amara TaxID=228776 RepID=A0ABD0ZPS6_CARAN